MMRTAVLAFVMALITGAALVASAQTKLPNKMSIQVPPGTVSFQPGPNVNVVQANCLVCHNADYIYNQPPLTKGQWTAEVNKMRGVYKATIADADVPKIVDYLVSQNGR
ncbi:MAG: cytochrome c [Vulcanimicrobiaceae bacterium]